MKKYLLSLFLVVIIGIIINSQIVESAIYNPYTLTNIVTGSSTAPAMATNFVATSTYDTSYFAGNLMIGNSMFNGTLDISSLGTGLAQFQVSTSTNDFAKVAFGNMSAGAQSMFCNIYNNGRSPKAGVSSSYYGGICFAGHNYSTAGFDGIRANGIAIFASDGDVSIGSASTNSASSSVRFFAGRGFAASNEDMVLSGGTANLGIGTTSPYAKLSVVGETVSRNFTATSTTATSTFATPLRFTKQYTPATSGATCTIGDFSWDASYMYICTATNTWERSALSAF